jgi:DNA (cytosine-5)-methyltransferase 1
LKPYNVIDLFAGPGGLGEGFSTVEQGRRFKIAVSAEMDEAAHRTLVLRSWFRHAQRSGKKKDLGLYYDFCANPEKPSPLEDKDNPLTKQAEAEVLQVVLGTPLGNRRVDEAIAARGLNPDETVVIGGPPCQAYSLVGRARNRGNAEYVPENDKRHFLYKEYLRILAKWKPKVFVMENVKGILSARVSGGGIFERILEDLKAPGRINKIDPSLRYIIHPVVERTDSGALFDLSSSDPHVFIVRAERYGVPQARHRVILLGVREDLRYDGRHVLNEEPDQATFADALVGLPPRRSRVSTGDDLQFWGATIISGIEELLEASFTCGIDQKTQKELRSELQLFKRRLKARDYSPGESFPGSGREYLNAWYFDGRLSRDLNHETRSHMATDLVRYFYAACFGRANMRSPKGFADFAHPSLRPAHENWESGKFADRFKVQLPDRPSTTVTSHISKDGHYFIHPDPQQCRSLTVREAARLQTFPDNYFFQGNRTQQYHQVGNAVPPYLAYQIAGVVAKIMRGAD